MEDKMFELMKKMYSEITGRLDTMDKKLETVDKRLETVDKKLDSKADKHDIVRLEDKMTNDSKALFDGYTQTFEKIAVVEKKVEDLATKIEKQDVEIRVIKGGKTRSAK